MTMLVVAAMLMGLPAWATHIRAGEITAVRLGGDASLRFRFTLTVYTDDNSTVTNPTATIVFGDGSQATVGRVRPPTSIPGSATSINQYEAEHTYPGPGSYTVYYTEQNRNLNVLNMTNSGQTNFYIETRITLDPLLGVNNSPVLLSAPVDQGSLRKVYRHNPAAYDPDGDSLSFELTPSRQFVTGIGPRTVAGFQYPDAFAGGLDSALAAPARLWIDARTGQLTWNVPNTFVGEYNVAFRIIEWRRNRFGRMVQLGYVIRDMQIIISDSRNNPPLLKLPANICTTPGHLIRVQVEATDPDQATTAVNITATGGPLVLTAPSNPATLSVLLNEPRLQIAQLQWRPVCNDVRKEPYNIVFRATEVSPLLPRLVDVRPYSITINGPRPTRLVATARADAALLTWDNYQTRQCSQADSIIIFRRAQTAITDTTGCSPGMNLATGYVRVAAVPANQIQYLDDDAGRGLRTGIIYSYRLVASFPQPKGGLSYPSEADTMRLRLGTPSMTRASVLTTSTTNGKVQVTWTRPLEPDTFLYKPPYTYTLQHEGTGGWADVFTTTNWQQDTTYTDSTRNTRDQAQRYRLQFGYWAQTQGGLVQRTLTAATATTPFLVPSGSNRSVVLVWEASTPWQNFGQAPVRNGISYPFRHIIQRLQLNGWQDIDSVIVTGQRGTYTDRGTYLGQPLVLGQEYQYRILTRGGYPTAPLPPIVANWSQQASGIPIDTTSPPPPGDTTDNCTPNRADLPTLLVQGCDNCPALQDPTTRFNELTWAHAPLTNPCDVNTVSYQVYFTPKRGGAFTRVATLPAVEGRMNFRHSDGGSLAGCYYLTATNNFGIESRPGRVFCADNCPAFQLPNVISPGVVDGLNDAFSPYCSVPEFVEEMETRIYNRYGAEVHRTQDPGINWRGTQQQEGGVRVPAGTYFYYIKVRFRSLDEAPTQVYRGWLEVVY